MIRMQVQLTEDQARALRELAHQERSSVAELVRRALDFWLPQRAVNAEVKARAQVETSRFFSEPLSIAEPPGAYLVEAPRAATAAPIPMPPRTPALVWGQTPPLEPGDRLTAREFERRYEAMPHIKKAELIEGVVYMSSPVRVSHAVSHSTVLTWLGVYCGATSGVQLADNATLRLDPDNVVQPDALLRLEPAHGGRSQVTADNYYAGAPELIVEVATSSAAYDLYEKRLVYRRNGVQEYIVWQVLENRLDWWRLVEGEYVEITADSDGLLRSQVFPGLWLAPQALLAGKLQLALTQLQAGLVAAEHEQFVRDLTADVQRE